MDAKSDDLFSAQSSDCESEEELDPISYSKYLELKKSGHTSQRGYILQTSDVYSSDEDVTPPSPKRSKVARKTSTPQKRKKGRKNTPQPRNAPQNVDGPSPKPTGAPTSHQSKDEVVRDSLVLRILHAQSSAVLHFVLHMRMHFLCS